ncbi:MAG: PrpF domain-containing protein [Candidatus Limnocylindrales bacterium]|nr:PrpF domain-containing protein [Candidatus Limnocylindrales bacterium]
MTDAVPVRCSILRGGTSRAVFFLANDLPAGRPAIEPLLLNIFGSPDIRQIDGLGGATSQTSKAAIIGPPTRPDADVDYTFAQVTVGQQLVDWGGNCGNISAAVGPFAINQGFVRACEPITTVRVHNTNTGKIILAHVPVRGGRAAEEGDYAVPGVPGTSCRILLEFSDPAGSLTGRLLPTGNPRDRLELDDGRSYEVSIIDAANPVVFVAAGSLGLTGTELPLEIEAATAATDVLEALRSVVAEMLGLVPDRRNATQVTPGLPKVGFVARPMAYTTTAGVEVPESAVDLTGRLMSMQTAHRSYMATGAIATAAAAFVDGSIVHELVRPIDGRPIAESIRIGHPYGVMEAVVNGDGPAAVPAIRGVALGRTARHILDGQVWVPRRLVAG